MAPLVRQTIHHLLTLRLENPLRLLPGEKNIFIFQDTPIAFPPPGEA